MKEINLLNPYSFFCLWEKENGKKFINDLVNKIIGGNEEYNIIDFKAPNINNVRSYVVFESKSNVVFIDFNFKDNTRVLKTDLILNGYLGLTYKKNNYLVLFNDFIGSTNKIFNIYDIYNNDKDYEYIFCKDKNRQLELNEEITNSLYEMSDDEYEHYNHENVLKDRI